MITKRLQRILINEHPKVFKGASFRVANPWFGLLMDLSALIEGILDEYLDAEFVPEKIKQKNGELRFEFECNDSEASTKIIRTIEILNRAFSETCEICGEKGGIYNTYSHFKNVLCQGHYELSKNFKSPFDIPWNKDYEFDAMLDNICLGGFDELSVIYPEEFHLPDINLVWYLELSTGCYFARPRNPTQRSSVLLTNKKAEKIKLPIKENHLWAKQGCGYKEYLVTDYCVEFAKREVNPVRDYFVDRDDCAKWLGESNELLEGNLPVVYLSMTPEYQDRAVYAAQVAAIGKVNVDRLIEGLGEVPVGWLTRRFSELECCSPIEWLNHNREEKVLVPYIDRLIENV